MRGAGGWGSGLALLAGMVAQLCLGAEEAFITQPNKLGIPHLIISTIYHYRNQIAGVISAVTGELSALSCD